MNNAVLSGNLGFDPEIKYFESGTAKARMRLAVRRPGKKDVTDWIDVVAWGKTAESAAEHLKKGSSVAFVGSVQVDEYEKDGEKRRQFYLNANSWEFVGGKKDDNGGNGGGEQSDDNIPF